MHQHSKKKQNLHPVNLSNKRSAFASTAPQSNQKPKFSQSGTGTKVLILDDQESVQQMTPGNLLENWPQNHKNGHPEETTTLPAYQLFSTKRDQIPHFEDDLSSLVEIISPQTKSILEFPLQIMSRDSINDTTIPSIDG